MNLTSFSCKKEKKTMPTHYDLRQKYPRWAHRRDANKRRRRKSRRKSRRKRRRRKGDKAEASRFQGTSTEGMLVSLLQQIMLGQTTLAKKHGENVKTGYAGLVKPDFLAPNRSRAEYQATSADRERRAGGGGGGAGAGAAAVIGAPVAAAPH